MKFFEVVFTLQVEHRLMGAMLDSIARSNYVNARKKLFIFKQLLINHFLVEEFVLYPFIKKQMIDKEATGQLLLSGGSADFDFEAIVKEMESFNAVGVQAVGTIAECLRLEEDLFQENFARVAEWVRARVLFEETRLFKDVDTSKVKLLRKTDFTRVRIEG
ncbi:MAG: hypothetical protein HQL80_00015 [Magnetococcales bacterium]|nr:hypothetical protein [Magnetococcales bacterium]